MPRTDQDFEDLLRSFAGALTRKYQSQVPGQEEDQLKGPMETLITGAGKLLGISVVAKTESKYGTLGRPDFGVDVGGLLTGHIELKGPSKNILPSKLKDVDREQWKRFMQLPNVIYSNGNGFILYRKGEEKGRVFFKGDVRTDGEEAATEKNGRDLRQLLAEFFGWEPIVPRNPKALAEMLAPLCHILKEDVLAAVQDENSKLHHLAQDWRNALFPDADDAQFADAYAQTLTYSLLLARVYGADDLDPDSAADALAGGHGLLAQALRVLSDRQVVDEIGLGLSYLKRAISAVNPTALASTSADPWLYFYEDFLAAYDPKLRNDRGVYYTPVEVVKTQVNLVSELLQTKFGKPLAFAEDDVVILDPAVGTGTYPLAAFEQGMELVEDRYGPQARAARATEMAKNLHAFEILVGPYAVAHLRLTQAFQGADATLPTDGVHVYLTDTLESPNVNPKGQIPLFHAQLAEEHKRAQQVKAATRVLVCIGNPPYDRQQIEPGEEGLEQRKGGWVRRGDSATLRPILEDFLEPARQAGQGIHLKNLYNDYVYFWRWALWKVFEQSEGPGIVSFITASSYLRGPGFLGMREVMRRHFDEMWIIDLEGDNLGARKTENVFNIQTPVAIAIGVRHGDPNPDQPAVVRYTKITGSREEKLEALGRIGSFDNLTWETCFSGWNRPFLPEREGDYYAWPLLTDLFPWQHSGVQFKRTWPIGETREVLERRWAALLAAEDRAKAFRETRDRKIEKTYPPLVGADRAQPIDSVQPRTPPPTIARFGYRSLDRQWVLADSRLGDFLRRVLWASHSPGQVFMTSLLTNVLGPGPAASVTAYVPDLHHFRGSFGAKEIIPLWRNASRTRPNVTSGLLDALLKSLGPVRPEDLFAYVYGVLAGPAYVDHFSEELTLPGPRIPITKDPTLFKKVADLGKRLVWLHTYGERFRQDDWPMRIQPGRARLIVAIPTSPDQYPNDFSYDEASKTVRVGSGVITDVAPDVWEFSISGLEVVKSWLAYRKARGAGKTSSELDEIRPAQWTASMTEEFLELLWVIEATLELFPEHERLLKEVITGETFNATELPTPTEDEREAPEVGTGKRADQEALFSNDHEE